MALLHQRSCCHGDQRGVPLHLEVEGPQWLHLVCSLLSLYSMASCTSLISFVVTMLYHCQGQVAAWPCCWVLYNFGKLKATL